MKMHPSDVLLEELIAEWSAHHMGERFGQYLWNTLAHYGRIESPDGNPFFFIDDEDLIRMLRGRLRQQQGEFFDGNDGKE